MKSIRELKKKSYSLEPDPGDQDQIEALQKQFKAEDKLIPK